MSHDALPSYGLWSLAIINTLVFAIFAFSFYQPKTARDWRSFDAFTAFLVALFTEMYGFPLTVIFCPVGLLPSFRASTSFARRRPFARDDVRLARESAFRPVPHCQQRADLRRIHPSGVRMVGAAQGAAARRTRDDRRVCAHPASGTPGSF